MPGYRIGYGFLTVILAGAAGSCEGEAGRPKPKPQVLVQLFPIPTAGAQPQGIAAGPDGGIWFTERNANKIGRIEVVPPHTITEYALPTPASGPYAITAGADGRMWFTEHPGIGSAGSTRVAGEDFRAPIPTSNSWTRAITTGPDRNVWSSRRRGESAGGRRPVPTIGDFPLPRYGTAANDIAAGPDGNLVRRERRGLGPRARNLAREHRGDPAAAKKADSAISRGSDGNLWVAQSGTGTIARIRATAPHVVTELRLPGAATEPKGLCASPGYLWLSRTGQNAILRIEVAPPHHIREIPVPESVGPPEEIVLGSDGNIWFTAPAGNGIAQLSLRALEVAGSAPENQSSVPAVPVAEYEAEPGPVAQGELEIRTDVNCTVSIDGVEMFRLSGGEGRVVPARVGRHVVAAVSALGPERWERSVEVFSGYRASAFVELRRESRGEGPDSATFVPSDPRIEFVPIPAGEFVMGSESGFKDEQPPHRVRLTRSFQMGKYEVTQKEWAAVMGPILLDTSGPEWIARPAGHSLHGRERKDPVLGVSWDDAQEFIEVERPRQFITYIDSRPSGVEYGCRAGTTVDLPPDIDRDGGAPEELRAPASVRSARRSPTPGVSLRTEMRRGSPTGTTRNYYRRTPEFDPPGPSVGQPGCFEWRRGIRHRTRAV